MISIKEYRLNRRVSFELSGIKPVVIDRPGEGCPQRWWLAVYTT